MFHCETSSLSLRGEIRQIRNDNARGAASFNLRRTRPRWEIARPPFGQRVGAVKPRGVKSCLLYWRSRLWRARRVRGLHRDVVAEPFEVVAHNQEIAGASVAIDYPVLQ